MTTLLTAPTVSKKWLKAAILLLPLCFQTLPAAQTSVLTDEDQGEQRRIKQEVDYWLLKAYSGDAEAQYRVGVMFAEGLGVKRNPKEAVRWYWESAEQGFPPAQFNLGDAYLRGIGVEQNYEQAVKFWHLAARAGLVPAQTNLGRAYYLGVGVERDLQKAQVWLLKATRSGDEVAGRLLVKIDSEPDEAPNIVRESDSVWVYGTYIVNEGSSGWVRGDGVRARTRPDTSNNSVIVGKLRNGQRVTVLGREGEWLLVRLDATDAPLTVTGGSSQSSNPLLSETTEPTMPTRVAEGYRSSEKTLTLLNSEPVETSADDRISDASNEEATSTGFNTSSSRDPFQLAPELVAPLQTKVAADLELPPSLSDEPSDTTGSGRTVRTEPQTAITALDLPPTFSQPSPTADDSGEHSREADESSQRLVDDEVDLDVAVLTKTTEVSTGSLPVSIESPIPVDEFPELSMIASIEPNTASIYSIPAERIPSDTELEQDDVVNSESVGNQIDTRVEPLPTEEKSPGKLAAKLTAIKRSLASLFRRKPKQEQVQIADADDPIQGIVSETEEPVLTSATELQPTIAGSDQDVVTTLDTPAANIAVTGTMESIEVAEVTDEMDESGETVVTLEPPAATAAPNVAASDTTQSNNIGESADETDESGENVVTLEPPAATIPQEIAVTGTTESADVAEATDELDASTETNIVTPEAERSYEPVVPAVVVSDVADDDNPNASGPTPSKGDLDLATRVPADKRNESADVLTSQIQTSLPDTEVDRLFDGNQWLYSQPSSHFTVQFASLGSEAEAIDFIEANDLEQALYLFSRRNNRDWYYIIAGSYPTRTEAAAVAHTFAQRVKSTWVRNLGALQSARCAGAVQLPEEISRQISSLCDAGELPTTVVIAEPDARSVTTSDTEISPDPSAPGGETGQLVDDNAWLFSRPKSEYTIQLLSTTSETGALAFVEKHSMESVKIFSTVKDDRKWYYILHGHFPSRDEAAQASQDLPVDSIMLRRFGVLQDARCGALSRLSAEVADALSPFCPG